MNNFQKTFSCIIVLMINFLLIQTDIQSQDDSLVKKDTSLYNSNEIDKALEANKLLVQKDTSKCDSNMNRKQQLKKTKKVKDHKEFFFSSLSLGGSYGKSDYMQGNFMSLRMAAGYWSESFPIPLSLSAMYSKEIHEEPAIYQADVGLSAWLPWGEHFPFFAIELGGGFTFGNIRVVNDTIINQKIEKVESIKGLYSFYYSVSAEMLFAGIGDDLLFGIMCSYTGNSKRNMTSFMLVIHYAKPF